MFKYLIAGAAAAYALYQLVVGGDRNEPPPSRFQSHEPTYPRSQVPRYEVRPPSRPPQPYERISSQPQAGRRDERQYQQNLDSSREERTPVDTYASLRAKAKQEGDLMAQCFKQSQDAYERRDRALAKALSEQGKRHSQKKDQLNAQASAIIFKENNQDKNTCQIDLHGLYVKEAISYSEKAIAEARRKGESEIRLIVGQGTHSDGGIARLKPAIHKDMQMRGFQVEVHPKNSGMLVVRFDDR